MKLYTDSHEEALHLRRRGRTWQRSGLLTASAAQLVEQATETGLKQTNLFFRLLFFGFTSLGIGALVGLVVTQFRLTHSSELRVILAIAGVICGLLAEYSVRRFRLYHHGIEEALGVGAVALLAGAFAHALEPLRLNHHTIMILLSLFVATGSAWTYHRFGWLYAYVAAAGALAILPFQFSLPAPMTRATLFALLSLLFAINFLQDRHARALFQRSRNALLQAGLILAMYLSVHLRLADIFSGFSAHRSTGGLIPPGWTPSTYFFTYALVWILPVAALAVGLRFRKRAFIDAGILALLLTLVTNKAYLGQARQLWDGAVLGSLLFVAALLALRFLSNPAREARTGLTSKNVLKPENSGLELAAAVAAAAGSATLQPPAKPPSFGGGSAGGGGAGRGF